MYLNKRFSRFIIYTILILVMTILVSEHTQSILADEITNTAPEITGTSAILMDADTGAVLFSQNPHERLYPASITKIMTGLLAVENLNLEDTITYSDEIINSLPSDAAKLGLVAGETTSIRDALYALLLRSANEVAVGLSIKISGSQEAFGALMTERARTAGALDTNFCNPSGLHDDNHYTTAYDMAMITKTAMENSEFSTIWGSEKYILNETNISEKYRIWHRHSMLLTASELYYPYAIGGKTGYTDEAGRTLVTAAEKNGLKLICVIMKSDDSHIFADTTALFEYGFNNFRKVNVQEEETRFGAGNSSIPVMNKLYGNNTGIFSLSNTSILIPNNVPLSEIPYTLKFLDNPEKNVIADITYEYNGNYLGQTSLIMNLSNNSETSPIGPKRVSTVDNRSSSIKETTSINIYFLAGGVAGGIIFLFVLVKAIKYSKKMAQVKKRRKYYK